MTIERSKDIALIVSVLIMSFAISYAFSAWTEPSASPPDGNVSAPVNVSDTGQTKTGAMTVQGDFTAPIFYDTVSTYYVNPSGSSNLSGNLTIGGYASSSQLCIGTDCKTSWAGMGNWTLSGSDLYPTETSYNVGIGTTTPSAKLDVVGDFEVSGNANICHLVYFDIGGASCPDGYYTWDAVAAAASGYMMCCKVDNPL